MIEAIIFDAEGVVFDSESAWDRGQVEFLGRRGVVYEREKLKPLLTGRSLVEGVKVMQEMYGFSGDPEVLAKERVAIVSKFFNAGLLFIEGFGEFYQKVRGDYKTCIATALTGDLLTIVERTLELSRLFAGNVFSIADVGNIGKPQPNIFLYAARTLHTPVERCLVIEDSPLGVEAAKRAGMKCIALITTYKREMLASADWVVDGYRGIDLSTM
jgi:beta-phosphoglucomutase-like phosphatase (HAD superfamily)